jgi:hypothetical protein
MFDSFEPVRIDNLGIPFEHLCDCVSNERHFSKERRALCREHRERDVLRVGEEGHVSIALHSMRAPESANDRGASLV